MNFSIVDIVVLALLLIVAISYLVKGFHKAGINDIMLIGIIVGVIFLTPMLVAEAIKLPFVINIKDSLTASLASVSPDLGETLTSVIVYAIVIAVLFLALWLISKLLKLILRAILKPRNKFFKVFDKILGMIFGVALYGVIFLGVVGAVATVEDPTIQAEMQKSIVQQNNPLAEFCEKNLNVGDFILSLNPQPPEEGGEGSGDEGAGDEGSGTGSAGIE